MVLKGIFRKPWRITAESLGLVKHEEEKKEKWWQRAGRASVKANVDLDRQRIQGYMQERQEAAETLGHMGVDRPLWDAVSRVGNVLDDVTGMIRERDRKEHQSVLEETRTLQPEQLRELQFHTGISKELIRGLRREQITLADFFDLDELERAKILYPDEQDFFAMQQYRSAITLASRDPNVNEPIDFGGAVKNVGREILGEEGSFGRAAGAVATTGAKIAGETLFNTQNVPGPIPLPVPDPKAATRPPQSRTLERLQETAQEDLEEGEGKLGFLGAAEVIGEESSIGPDILNPTNLIPLPFIEPLIAKGLITVARGGARVVGRVATAAGADRVLSFAGKLLDQQATKLTQAGKDEMMEALVKEYDANPSSISVRELMDTERKLQQLVIDRPATGAGGGLEGSLPLSEIRSRAETEGFKLVDLPQSTDIATMGFKHQGKGRGQVYVQFEKSKAVYIYEDVSGNTFRAIRDAVENTSQRASAGDALNRLIKDKSKDIPFNKIRILPEPDAPGALKAGPDEKSFRDKIRDIDIPTPSDADPTTGVGRVRRPDRAIDEGESLEDFKARSPQDPDVVRQAEETASVEDIPRFDSVDSVSPLEFQTSEGISWRIEKDGDDFIAFKSGSNQPVFQSKDPENLRRLIREEGGRIRGTEAGRPFDADAERFAEGKGFRPDSVIEEAAEPFDPKTRRAGEPLGEGADDTVSFDVVDMEEPPGWGLRGASPDELPPSAANKGIVEGSKPNDIHKLGQLITAHLTGETSRDFLRNFVERNRDVPFLNALIRVGVGVNVLARQDAAYRNAVGFQLMRDVQEGELTNRVRGLVAEIPWKKFNAKEGTVTVKNSLGNNIERPIDRIFDDIMGSKSNRQTYSDETIAWVEDASEMMDTLHDELNAVITVEAFVRNVKDPVERKYLLDYHDFQQGRRAKPPRRPKETNIKTDSQAEDMVNNIMKDVNELEIEKPGTSWMPRFIKQGDGKWTLEGKLSTGKKGIHAQQFYEDLETAIFNGERVADPVHSISSYASTLQSLIRNRVLKTALMLDKVAVPTAVAERAGKRSGKDLGLTFADLQFTPEDLRKLNSVLGSGGEKLALAGQVASIPRLLVTGLADVGQFGIQMLTLFASDPSAYAKAWGRSMQAMVDPKGFARYVRNAPESIQAAKYGVDLGTSELTEAAYTGPLTKLGPLSKVLEIVPRGFDGALTSGRIMKFNGLANLARKGGDPESELYHLARYVNTAMGTPGMRGLGISATQTQIESAFIFFSQRYTRSIFGMIAYAGSKGIAARDARRTLLAMMAGATAATYGFGRAAGLSHQEALERLKPTSGSKFMSIPIAGQEFGFGSGFRSTMKFAGDLYIEGIKIKNGEWDYDSLSEAALKNPIARYFRGRTSPVTGTLLDFITGEDFIGQEVSIDAFVDNPAALADYASDRLLPINFRSYLEARGSQPARLAALATETVGGRTRSISRFTLFEDARNEVSQELFGQDFEDLKSGGKAGDQSKVAQINEDPRVVEAQNNLDEGSRRFPQTGEDRFFDENTSLRDRQRAEQESDDEGLADYFIKGEGKGVSPDTWKDRLVRRQSEYAGRRDQLISDFNIEFEDQINQPGTVNAALDKYYAITVEDYEDPTTLEINWDSFFTARDGALSSIKGSDRRRVETYLQRNDTDLLREFRVLRDELGGYYDTEIGTARTSWRVANPRGDAALYLLGSVTTIRSDTARRLATQMGRSIYGGTIQEAPFPVSGSGGFGGGPSSVPAGGGPRSAPSNKPRG